MADDPRELAQVVEQVRAEFNNELEIANSSQWDRWKRDEARGKSAGLFYALRLLKALPPPAVAQPAVPQPLEEWHEDCGPVVWFAWVDGGWQAEPAWIGSPLDSDWPEYHTHFIPHPLMPAPPET